MDKLRKEIKGIKNKLNVIEPSLAMCHICTNNVEKTQEYIEHRLCVNDYMEQRILQIEDYLNVIHRHLNDTITRVNNIHVYLKNKEDEDLLCHETMPDSDDDMETEKTEPLAETCEKTEQ